MTYPSPRGLLDVLRNPFAKPGGTEALRSIDLAIESGQVFGLLGPNGAGKMTLTRILCNLVIPTQGRVLIDGNDIALEPGKCRKSVGFISSDERSFFWRLTGLENLLFFAPLYEVPRKEARLRINFYLDFFGIGAQARRRFGLLSSGQKKLFSVVRALVPDPPILLFDEPTNSLDPGTSARLMDHVREELSRRRGKTVLWATHRLEEAREMCDTLMVVDHGTCRFSGSVADFAALGAGLDGARSLMEVFRSLEGRMQRRRRAEWAWARDWEGNSPWHARSCAGTFSSRPATSSRAWSTCSASSCRS